MKNLFLLLWKNNFLILFLMLSAFSCYLIYDQQQYHRSALLNSSNVVVSKVMVSVNTVRQYLWLQKNNQMLAEQNSKLLAESELSFYNNTIVTDSVADTLYKQQYRYVVARVINNSVNKQNNFLTIDKGLAHGIKPDMGVIGPAGVVGVVKDVSEHFATVQSLLHNKWTPSARLKGSNFFGHLSWDGTNPAYITLQSIPANVKVNPGDTVTTTDFSTLFPDGVMVGIVSAVKQKQAGDNHDITVKLATGFQSISHVYVVINNFKTERIQLEAKTAEADKQSNGN